MHNQIQIKVPDGAFAAYIARPRVTPAPAIVVIHEVFGVNADLRQSCDELAAQGYLAICPDLFWRIEPGVELTDRTEAERAKGLALYSAFDLDAGVADIAAAIEAARGLQESTGKAGVVGYCLGGLMSLLDDGARGSGRRSGLLPRQRRQAPGGGAPGGQPADRPSRRRGRIHLQAGATADRCGSRRSPASSGLQLPRLRPRLRSTSWDRLRRRGGRAGQRSDQLVSGPASEERLRRRARRVRSWNQFARRARSWRRQQTRRG